MLKRSLLLIFLVLVLLSIGTASAHIIDNFDDSTFNTSLLTWVNEPNTWDEGTTRADTLYVYSTADVSPEDPYANLDHYYATIPYDNYSIVVNVNASEIHDTYEAVGIFIADASGNDEMLYALRGSSQIQVHSYYHNASSGELGISDSIYNYDCDNLQLNITNYNGLITTSYKSDLDSEWVQVSQYTSSLNYTKSGQTFTARLTSPLDSITYTDSFAIYDLDQDPEPETYKTFYVTNSGDNGNTGLNESDAFSTITYALSQMGNGDTLYIKAGSYTEAPQVGISNVSIIGYGGIPIIDLNQNDFTITGSENYISNLDVYNGGEQAGGGANVYVSGSDNILDNITSHDGYNDGNGYSITGNGTQIINCEGYQNGYNGLLIASSNSVFVDGYYGHNEYNHNAIDLYNAVDNITIQNSTIEDCSGSGIFMHNGTVGSQTNLTIKNNQFTNISLKVIVSDISTNTVTEDSIISNNIINGTGQTALLIYSGYNNLIENNTISNVESGYFGIQLLGSANNNVLKNNTLISETYEFGFNSGTNYITDDNSDSIFVRAASTSPIIIINSTSGQFYLSDFGNSTHYINGTSELVLTSPTEYNVYEITKSDYGCYPTLSTVTTSNLSIDGVDLTSAELQDITLTKLSTSDTQTISLDAGTTHVAFDDYYSPTPVNPTFVAVGGGFAAVIFAIGSWINQRRKRW
jgi:hypothetical protein